MKKQIFRRLAAIASACAVMAAAAPVYTVVPAVAASNLISNSTFESGTAGWVVYKESGGSATLGTDNGRLALHVSSIGKVTYAVQAYYDIIPLYQNGVYHFKYDISSTVDRYVEGMIQQNGGTYQAYTWKGLNLTSQPQTIDYTFTMEAESDIMAKLVFNCGNEGDELPEHTIYIDNVTLELVDDSNVDYSTTKPYEPPIVVNQIGYKPENKKTAVFRKITDETTFSVVNADTKAVVYTGNLTGGERNGMADETDWIGDFSEVTEPGKYYITCGSLDNSYTFEIGDDIYNNLLDDSIRMLYLQRCGTKIEDDEFGHPVCHNTMATIYGTNEKIDVSGGWHDAGDYGRYVVPGAKAVADLLYAYDANPGLFGDNLNIPESGNGVPDILDEARYELEWMMKMQAESGGVYHKVTCENFPAYVMPQNETAPLIVTPVSSTATADFCAVMAMAYEFYLDFDTDFAEECLSRAEKAWTYLEQNPEFDFTDPVGITTGSYGDTSDTDERYWAAAQMYRATGESKYYTTLESMSAPSGLDWMKVGGYGCFAIVTMDNIDKESAVYTKAESRIISDANTAQKNSASNPYGESLKKYEWGSNMPVATSGMNLSIAYSLTGNKDYLTAANEQLNYLLGKNAVGTCFVTGYGTVSPQNPHHRPSMSVGHAMKGMLVGGVNSALEDSAAKAYCAGAPAAKCYIDNSESYSTNEITIYWNSPLTCLLAMTSAADKNEQIEGDINGDNEFNAADLVTLQKYILQRISTVENYSAGDLNGDGILNSIDVVLMRKKLFI